MSQSANRWRAELAGKRFSSSFLSSLFQAIPSVHTLQPSLTFSTTRAPTLRLPFRPWFHQTDHLNSWWGWDDVTAEMIRWPTDLQPRKKWLPIFIFICISFPASSVQLLLRRVWTRSTPTGLPTLLPLTRLRPRHKPPQLHFCSSAVTSQCCRPLHENKQESESALKGNQRPSQRVTSFPSQLKSYLSKIVESQSCCESFSETLTLFREQPMGGNKGCKTNDGTPHN